MTLPAMMFSSLANVAAGDGPDDDAPAGQSLAGVVVGVAGESKGHAARYEGAEALAGRALEVDLDQVVREVRARPVLA